jgi:hypothetical protein
MVFMGLGNFLIAAVVSWCIGGTAYGGKVEGGRYFVGTKKKLTEVSPAVWTYSRIHNGSNLWVTPPLVFIGACLVIRGQRRKKEFMD